MIRISGSNVTIKDFTKENYQTKMLFRCTSLLYAERFLETGNIRFGLPQEWIDEYKVNGDGRGDLLEGCYCCMPNFNLSVANFYKSLRPNVEIFRDSRTDYLYFRSKDVLDMRTFCLFGLDVKDFHIDASDEEKNPTFTLHKKYFEDFSNVSKEMYDKLPSEEKPVLLMINNPKEFHKRLRNFMHNFGVNDDEWIIHPIGYSEKNTHFLIGDDMPSELFSKDISFEYQKEIRVVVCTKRDSIVQKFNKCNGIVNLGCMKDIASIEEYYFDDMKMQLKGNNKMIYTLPRPVYIPLVEMEPETLMAMIQQAYDNRIPGEDLSDEGKRNTYIKPIVDVLDDNFDIEFNYMDVTFKKRGTFEKIKIQLLRDE